MLKLNGLNFVNGTFEQVLTFFVNIIYSILQLRVPVIVHAVRTVGYWLRDGRRTDPSDNPAEQVLVPSASRRTARGIVSVCYEF